MKVRKQVIYPVTPPNQKRTKRNAPARTKTPDFRNMHTFANESLRAVQATKKVSTNLPQLWRPHKSQFAVAQRAFPESAHAAPRRFSRLPIVRQT